MNLARKIITRFPIDPLGMAMPGPRLSERVCRIIEGGATLRVSRVRAAGIVAACAVICAVFAAGTLVHASAQSSDAARPATSQSTTQGQQTPATSQAPSTLAFDAASLKPRDGSEPVGIIGMQTLPGRLVELCASLNDLVWYAYHITWVRPEGLPEWARKQCSAGSPEYTYDFQATMPAGTTTDQARQMLQNFLADRFKLAAHWEKKDVPTYALVVGPGGFKLKPLDHASGPPPTAQFTCPPEDPACHRMLMTSMGAGQLAAVLSNSIGRPVIDKTGLKDAYVFDLRWAGDAAPDSPLPSLPAALRESFGLELKSETAPADVLVIDHAEKPTPN
jgi:uncharacterized protein (TIGR03435 family)